MGIFFGWIIFSLIVGLIGTDRKIGFFGAFLVSLILSPVIGLIITLVSKDLKDEKYKQNILKAQKSQQEALEKLSNSKSKDSSKISILDELERLKKLKDENLISESEFQTLKDKIINSK